VTQGAASDLEQVRRICREMVTRYGFSSLGPVALEGDDHEVFLGRDWIRSEPHYSAATGRKIDAQVRSLACQALDRALAILRPRRELMDRLVDRLIAEETIDGTAFHAEVEAWERQHPGLPLGVNGAREGSALAGAAASESDVEAAQVGV
jgi:cell division protease FtsH